jgi:hypothetical protein
MHARARRTNAAAVNARRRRVEKYKKTPEKKEEKKINQNLRMPVCFIP